MIQYNFSFRKLNVYQISRTLVKDIYELVNAFPPNEKYALGDQMRRAVVSIPSNIAEGTAKTSPKDQFRFLEISYGSLMELMCQTEIALDLSVITYNFLPTAKGKKVIEKFYELTDKLIPLKGIGLHASF